MKIYRRSSLTFSANKRAFLFPQPPQKWSFSPCWNSSTRGYYQFIISREKWTFMDFFDLFSFFHLPLSSKLEKILPQQIFSNKIQLKTR